MLASLTCRWRLSSMISLTCLDESNSLYCNSDVRWLKMLLPFGFNALANLFEVRPAMRMKFLLALLFVLMLLYQPAYSQEQNRNDDDIVRVRTRMVFVDTLVQDQKTGANFFNAE